MLKINFLPYTEIENLGTYQRIKKILNMVKDKRIIILEGRLKREEETELIKVTMQEIDKTFKGIELAVMYPGDTMGDGAVGKLRSGVAGLILGKGWTRLVGGFKSRVLVTAAVEMGGLAP